MVLMNNAYLTGWVISAEHNEVNTYYWLGLNLNINMNMRFDKTMQPKSILRVRSVQVISQNQGRIYSCKIL